MKNLKTVIALLLLSQTICTAQTQFKNCANNTLLQNVIVNNAATKEWIGNTNEQGMLTIPANVSEIKHLILLSVCRLWQTQQEQYVQTNRVMYWQNLLLKQVPMLPKRF